MVPHVSHVHEPCQARVSAIEEGSIVKGSGVVIELAIFEVFHEVNEVTCLRLCQLQRPDGNRGFKCQDSEVLQAFGCDVNERDDNFTCVALCDVIVSLACRPRVNVKVREREVIGRREEERRTKE